VSADHSASRRRWRRPLSKRPVGLAVVIAALVSASSAAAGEKDVRSCDFEVKARCASGDARVTLADGVVQRLEVNVFWCGLRGHPGYTCTIDSSRGDADAKWSEEAGATLIANTAPFNPQAPDRVKVTAGKNVSIDMEQAQSLGRCGAGAELPRMIVIPERGKACQVRLPSP